MTGIIARLIVLPGLAVTNAALFFLMPEVVTWFNLSAEASAMCTHVVHWFNLFSIFFWATSFTLPNALRAGGDAKFTMSVSIVSMWLFRVILSYIFVQHAGPADRQELDLPQPVFPCAVCPREMDGA